MVTANNLQPSRSGRDVALPDDRGRIAFQGLEARSVAVAPESQIEDGFTDPKIFDGEFGEPFRQSWIDVELAGRRVGLKADDHLKHGETRSRRPGLRYVGAQVLDWKVGWITLHTGIEFRHLMLHEIAGGAADVPGDAGGFVNETVAAETHGDDSVVVRPYRAVLVGIGIIGR